MKKSVTLITGSEHTKITLHNQLREYLPGNFIINSYAEDEGIDHVVIDDLVILSSESVLNDLLEMNLLDTSCETVIAKRTINYDYIDEIVLLPPNTDVLMVNDSEEPTYSTISMLQKIGLNYINYIPYYPGIKGRVKTADIAITPGEIDKVPAFVKKVIDIKARIMDFQTIAEILNKLSLLDEKAGIFSEKYLKKIINIAKRLAISTSDISQLNKHLNLVLDGLNDGLLVYNTNGNISVLNENLKRVLSLSQVDLRHKNIKKVIHNNNLAEFLTRKYSDTDGDKVFNIDGIELLVSKFYVNQDNSIIAVFKNVKETMEANDRLRRELVKKGFYAKYTFADIIGSSESIAKVKEISKKLAVSDLTILIEGESGTGKELFASSVHNESKRNKGPFIAVNFSALSDELIESELFGYEEGAFTGAKKGGKAGIFELADGGTIFLDEIGDISLKVQARLLRVLQEKEVMRIGGTQIKPVDVRVIAATNKNLAQMVREKKFREDLYYRLKMGYIHIPPLRERKKDIYELINQFIREVTSENIQITQDVFNELLKYNWSGNIRELKNIIVYMLAVKEGRILTLKDIPDKGFFHEFTDDCFSVDNKYCTVAEIEDCNIDEEQLFILRKIDQINKNGKLVGRELLSSETIGTEYEITKYQMRSRLDKLEKLGLVIKKRGRHGTILTDRARVILSQG
jgi:transcriptional regulator with PAS, ATPase and Fis domain